MNWSSVIFSGYNIFYSNIELVKFSRCRWFVWSRKLYIWTWTVWLETRCIKQIWLDSQECKLVNKSNRFVCWVLPKNRSCLLVRTFLCFAGFHRQPSSGLLRGLLYLEVCKLRSAFSSELEITTFQKLLQCCFVSSFALFFGGQKISLCPAWSVLTSHSILRHRSRKNSTCATLLRAHRVLLRRMELLVSINVYTWEDIEHRCASC